MLFISPKKAQTTIAERLKELRLQKGLTQKGVSERSGVSLATLRKFEQEGKISLGSFVKICMSLGCIENIIDALNTPQNKFKTIDDVLKASPKKRQRGWRT